MDDQWEPSKYYTTINGERREILPRTKRARARESTGQASGPATVCSIPGGHSQPVDDVPLIRV